MNSFPGAKPVTRKTELLVHPKDVISSGVLAQFELTMLLELSVIPLGRGRSISGDVADLMKIIDASQSGLPVDRHGDDPGRQLGSALGGGPEVSR